MGLSPSDIDGDGQAPRAEFQTGPETWFIVRNTNGDGGLTTEDPAR